MSISQLYPAEGPTLNLNFAGSRTLDPRITFTRTQTTSNGSTYTGRDGLVKYAGPDEPRFDHRYVSGDIVGDIYNNDGVYDEETFEVITPPTKKDGYHINLILAGAPPSALSEFMVSPQNPHRVLLDKYFIIE